MRADRRQRHRATTTERRALQAIGRALAAEVRRRREGEQLARQAQATPPAPPAETEEQP